MRTSVGGWVSLSRLPSRVGVLRFYDLGIDDVSRMDYFLLSFDYFLTRFRLSSDSGACPDVAAYIPDSHQTTPQIFPYRLTEV